MLVVSPGCSPLKTPKRGKGAEGPRLSHAHCLFYLLESHPLSHTLPPSTPLHHRPPLVTLGISTVMSKSNLFAPTPSGSRPTSPPPTFASEEDKDRQALMMGPLGADRAKEVSQGAGASSSRDQGA